MPGAVSTTPARCMDVIAHSPANKRHIETANGMAERVLKRLSCGPVLDAEHSLKALFTVDTIARHASRQRTENANNVRPKWQA